MARNNKSSNRIENLVDDIPSLSEDEEVEIVEEEPLKKKRQRTDESQTQTKSSSSSSLSSSSDLDNKVLGHVQCSICYNTFHRPVILVPCSHVYCGSCISQCLKSDVHNCPECRSEIEQVIAAPKLLENIIDDLYVRFPEQKRGSAALLDLDRKDVVARGVRLPKFQQQQQHHHHRNHHIHYTNTNRPHPVLSVSQADIAEFMGITRASPHVARHLLVGAYQRGLTMQHAIEYYFGRYTN